jgi:sugar lactone lactonase YvrE
VEVLVNGTQEIVVGSGLSDPGGVAVDLLGNLFIADTYNNRVIEVPAAAQSGVQTTITVATGLNQPWGVAVDGRGDVFAGEFNSSLVVKLQNSNFGSVNACAAGQTSPAPCSQTLTLKYNVNSANTLGTPKVLTAGLPNLDFTLASASTCMGSMTAGTSCIVNVTFAPLSIGLRKGAVEIVDSSGNVLATTLIYGTGVGPQVAFSPVPAGESPATAYGLSGPHAVAIDSAGNQFIADAKNNRILKVSGSVVSVLPTSGLNGPNGVAVDGAGNVFISDLSRVVEVAAGTNTQTVVPIGVIQPGGVAVDGGGNLFVTDTYSTRDDVVELWRPMV